jgi:hypothetical protein
VENGLKWQVLRALESRPNQGTRWLRAALTETVGGLKAAAQYWESVVTESREICEALDAARIVAAAKDIVHNRTHCSHLQKRVIKTWGEASVAYGQSPVAASWTQG